VDALSRILHTARVSGSLFSRAELTSPWGVHSRTMPDAIFHVVVRGAGFITLDEDAQPISFRAGDLLILTRGHAHTMSDLPERAAQDMGDLRSVTGDDGLPCVVVDGVGPRTSLLCGTFTLDEDCRDHLLPLLPPLLHVQGGTPTAAWLDQTLRVMADEVVAERPGSAAVLTRLADILLVQALRAWLQQSASHATGWLGALDDPQLGRALSLIHDDPAEPWTAAVLARRVGLSRTVFYERFTARVGESPAAYLTRWRMMVARTLMRGTDDGLGEIAEQVGYRSLAAFHKAFKRVVGDSPGAWRREVRAA